MFTEVYNFFFEFLFNSVQPAYMSAQGMELTCILFTVITVCALILMALIPIKFLLGLLFRW